MFLTTLVGMFSFGEETFAWLLDDFHLILVLLYPVLGLALPRYR